MGMGLGISIFMVSGVILGVVFVQAYGLVQYIKKMDQDDSVCEQCEFHNTCIAVKSIGSSNVMTEFTYTTYQFVKKRCMYAKEKNWKYMLIFALLNGLLYAGLYLRYGMTGDVVFFCLCTTALIYVGVVDWNTQYIPAEFNIFILILGFIRMIMNPDKWLEQVIGLLAVSLLLLIIDVIGSKISGGNHVVGGGDIKLMAAAGLLLGWKLNIVAFMMGCILGSIIHLIIMKIGKGEHRLAFGPYLSMGIYIAMICGEQLMSWYLGIMGL